MPHVPVALNFLLLFGSQALPAFGFISYAKLPPSLIGKSRYDQTRKKVRVITVKI